MSRRPSSGWKWLLGVVLASIVAAAVGALMIWGYTESRREATAEAQSEQPIKPPIEVSRNISGAPTITLGTDLQKQADIETMQSKAAPYQRVARAYGSVLDLQPFTDLSNTIAIAKAQLAIAQAKLVASQAAFHRAQVLNKNEQNISTAQLQAAEATYQSDSATVQAAQVQMQNAAANAYQAWGPTLGQSLTEGSALAKDLLQHRKVLIQVTLPVGTPLVQAPQAASIETTAGERVKIEFVSEAPRTDPQTQGVSFFYTADAASSALPGMSVIAFLPVGLPKPGVAVPASAVVWLQGRAWVYVQTAANAFSRHEIPTTEPQPGGGYIVPAPAAAPPPERVASAAGMDGEAQGLPTDEPLVVKGAQLLLSQEFSAQIQAGGD
jgi:hypothetical protein